MRRANIRELDMVFNQPSFQNPGLGTLVPDSLSGASLSSSTILFNRQRHQTLLLYGERLAQVLIDKSSQGTGCLVEFQLNGKDTYAIIGDKGFLGIVDRSQHVIHDLQIAEGPAKDRLLDLYAEYRRGGFEIAPVDGVTSLEPRSSLKVSQLLESFEIERSFKDALSGAYTPNITCRREEGTEGHSFADSLFSRVSSSSPLSDLLSLRLGRLGAIMQLGRGEGRRINWRSTLRKAQIAGLI